VNLFLAFTFFFRTVAKVVLKIEYAVFFFKFHNNPSVPQNCFIVLNAKFISRVKRTFLDLVFNLLPHSIKKDRPLFYLILNIR